MGKVGQGAAGVAAALLALVFWGQGFPEAAMSYMPASWFNQEQIRASSERRDARNPVNPQESPPVVVSNAGQAPTAPESPAQLFKRAQDLVLVEGRVELDPEVVSLKLKAAEQGHVIAQYETALAYSALASVAGTPAEKQKHVAEVNRWLSRCATGKWSPCVFWVASSYELGDYGFPKNQNEATRYYRQLLGENGFSDKAQAALQRLGTN